MTPEKQTLGAHELGSYVYCPRAWWYDRHREGNPGSGPLGEDFRAGQEFHEEMMRAHVRRQERSGAPYAALAVVGAVLLGVMVWWFHWLPSFSWHW